MVSMAMTALGWQQPRARELFKGSYAGQSRHSLRLRQWPLFCAHDLDRATAFVQVAAIFRILITVNFGDIAKPYKEAWVADFSTRWIFSNHVSVSTCAILR